MNTNALGTKPTHVSNFRLLVGLPDSFSNAVEVAVYPLKGRAFPIVAVLKPLTR
jgi:hypothetical protein